MTPTATITAIPVQLDAAAFQRLTEGLSLLWPEPSGALLEEPIDEVNVSNTGA